MLSQLLKSFNRFHPRAWDFIQLLRLDRPIGIYLLMWPTLWALWIAGEGSPSIKNVVIFVIGVILMRSAGCAINDFADRGIDGDVARTKERPIVSGRVTAKEALITFAILIAVSFCLGAIDQSPNRLLGLLSCRFSSTVSVYQALHLLSASCPRRRLLVQYSFSL